MLVKSSTAARASENEAFRILSRWFSSGSKQLSPIPIDQEPYCRQRNELVLGNRIPVKAPDAWIAPTAVVIGDVDLYERVSCVLGACGLDH